MLATAAAKLAEGKALRGRLLILGGGVVPALAVTTLKHNVIARHKSSFQNLYFVLRALYFVLRALYFVLGS
jgi:hypothetical protein